jgi:hypothetical protein
MEKSPRLRSSVLSLPARPASAVPLGPQPHMTRGFGFSEEIVEGERQSATTRLKPHAMTHARALLPLIRSTIVVPVNPSTRLTNLPKQHV